MSKQNSSLKSMKESEKLARLARLVAEWNAQDIGDESVICKKAREVCYEFTRLHHRTFIREWNKLLEESAKEVS